MSLSKTYLTIFGKRYTPLELLTRWSSRNLILKNPVRKLQVLNGNSKEPAAATSKASYLLKQQYSTATVNVERFKAPSDEAEKKAFNDVFPHIVKDIENNVMPKNMPDVVDWFTGVFQYNVPNGKQIRGMMTVYCFKMLVPDATKEQLHLARIVGWCLEIAQAYLLVSDDIMDSSTTRRGQLCWYKRDNVGLKAINDALMLNAVLFKLLFRYIQDKECLLNIEDAFHDAIWYTTSGQCLDMFAEPSTGRPELNKYTHDFYSSIIQYKTSYYSICLPMRLALILAGRKNAYARCEDVLLKMGHLFQVQDDYIDCFGDPKKTGKIGMDIENGKCCWPIVAALQRIQPEDRIILEDNYGRQEPQCAQKVKDLYNKIGLKAVYEDYEKEIYQDLCQQSEIISREANIPLDIFSWILDKVYLRRK